MTAMTPRRNLRFLPATSAVLGLSFLVAGCAGSGDAGTDGTDGTTGAPTAGASDTASSDTAGGDDAAVTGPDVQALAQGLVDAGAVGAVAEVRVGDDATTAVAGTIAPDEDAAPDPAMTTRVASITKSMVATVILQLAEEGELSLDDPVVDHLPDLVPAGSGYTVRQVLQHTSGIGPLATVMPTNAAEIVAGATVEHTDEDLIRIATTEEPQAEPGGAFGYSNANYILLAHLAEAVTGRPMAELLQERVFAPASMADTTIPDDATMPDGSLRGSLLTDGGTTELTEYTPTLMSWGANAISTVGDLNRFYRTAFDGTLLDAESAEEMRTSGEQYFLGLLPHPYECSDGSAQAAYGNRGNGFGYAAASFHSPDGQRQVSLAWSGTGANPATDPVFMASIMQMTAGLGLTC